MAFVFKMKTRPCEAGVLQSSFVSLCMFCFVAQRVAEVMRRANSGMQANLHRR